MANKTLKSIKFKNSSDVYEIYDNQARTALENVYTKTEVDGKGYLTSHQTLKTINNESIVGTGNITIQGGLDSTNYYTKEQVDELIDIDDLANAVIAKLDEAEEVTL